MHYDGNLNSNPKNIEDLQHLKNGDKRTKNNTVLSQAQREQLVTWMKNNTMRYKEYAQVLRLDGLLLKKLEVV